MTRTAGAVVALVLGVAAISGAVAVQLAATASAPPNTAPGRTEQQATAHLLATFAGNRALARSAAAHLLSIAEPPPGAVRAAAAPARLTGIIIDPEVPDYVDDHGFWTVRLPPAAVLAFMGAHPPAAFSLTGNSHGGGPDAIQTLTFTEDTAPAWGTVRSEVAVSRLTAGTSGIRIDDVAEWLDPRPESDSGPGPRLRVTVAARCPASDARVVGVRSPGRGLTTRMVPTIAPTAARICSYSGLNSYSGAGTSRRFVLIGDRVVDATRAGQIAAAAAAVPLAHQLGAAFGCDADTGSEVAIALRYPGRPDVDLWYSPSGCGSLSNGRIFVIDSDFALSPFLN